MQSDSANCGSNGRAKASKASELAPKWSRYNRLLGRKVDYIECRARRLLNKV
jgi:hypothetical protein